MLKKLISLLMLTACANYPGEKSFTVRKDLSYTATKAERQQGDLYLPHGEGPFPVVVTVHGGGWKSRNRDDMDSIAESLASHGFAVFNMNYRFSPEHKHPAPVDDLTEALKFLRAESQRYQLNMNKVGLWGYSSGGHTVSFHALTKNADPELKVSAVVAGGAPYDFTWYPLSPYIHGYTGVYRDENLPLYIEASAVTHVHENAPAFFLYHAEKDELVEYAQQTAFEAKLKAKGVAVETYTVSFWGHAMAFALPDGPVESGINFLKKKLQ